MTPDSKDALCSLRSASPGIVPRVSIERDYRSASDREETLTCNSTDAVTQASRESKGPCEAGRTGLLLPMVTGLVFH